MSASLMPLAANSIQRGARVDAILDRYLTADYVRTDRLFAALLLLQWVVGIALAIWLTPLTWFGTEYHVHVHVWTAVFVGGALALGPVYLIYALPGRSVTRLTVGVAQMLWSALLIHLSGGRIETHFHIFGSLAFLAFYRDWRVIALATVVVFADHIVRDVLAPISVFGETESNLWRAVEHGVWVLFEDVFLLLSIRQRRNELRVIAVREAYHEEVQKWTEEEVARRTRQLVEKQTELQSIMDASPLGKFLTDVQGACIYVNAMACEITGLSRAACLGEGWACNIHPEDRAAALREWGEIFSNRRRMSRSHRIVREDGSIAWINVTSAPIYHGEKFKGFVGTIEEITQRIQAEQELLRMKEEAQAASASKSAFLANMSHELRTPMTAILGFVELLIGSLKHSENLDAAQTIQRNGEHLLNLINDILDLSKIEAGKVTTESIVTSPETLLREVLSLMQVRAMAKNLQLELELDGPVPAAIRTDPLRLRQVLMNLIGNAIKFTEVGGVRVVLRQGTSIHRPPKLRFEVHDTGVGLTRQQIDTLFEPFTQADSSTTRKYGGTGLGLTISKRLAELLGGTIDVRSEPGVGSVFGIELAYEVSELPSVVSAGSHAAHDLPKTMDQSTCCENLQVLLAEDGPDNQRLISFLLRKAGAQVTVVEHGQAALEAVEEALVAGREFDIILMDMQMPVMDGYTATQRLRSQGYARPIVALTAHAMNGDRERCLAAGCDDYATKPINRAKLLGLIAFHAQRVLPV